MTAACKILWRRQALAFDQRIRTTLCFWRCCSCLGACSRPCPRPRPCRPSTYNRMHASCHKSTRDNGACQRHSLQVQCVPASFATAARARERTVRASGIHCEYSACTVCNIMQQIFSSVSTYTVVASARSGAAAVQSPADANAAPR